MAYNKYFYLEQELRKATPEQRQAYVARMEAMKVRNQTDYDNAVKFRPSYAPKGRETKTESGTRLVLAETTELIEHVKSFLETLPQGAK